MKPDKRYVTQLTQNDLREIAAVANLSVGEGIVITRNEKGIELSIDKQAFTMWVKTIIAGGEIG